MAFGVLVGREGGWGVNPRRWGGQVGLPGSGLPSGPAHWRRSVRRGQGLSSLTYSCSSVCIKHQASALCQTHFDVGRNFFSRVRDRPDFQVKLYSDACYSECGLGAISFSITGGLEEVQNLRPHPRPMMQNQHLHNYLEASSQLSVWGHRKCHGEKVGKGPRLSQGLRGRSTL